MRPSNTPAKIKALTIIRGPRILHPGTVSRKGLRAGKASAARSRLDAIAARYPPRRDVDLDDLADMLSVVADGGIILSKVTKDSEALPRQVMLYRDFVRTIFLGA